MFGLPSIYLTIGVGVAGLIVGFWSGWETKGWKDDAAQLAAVHRAIAERDALTAKLNEVSTQYEAAKGQRDVVTKIITRKVDRVVVRYADRACLDTDGVQLVNDALAGKATDTSRPAGPMPPGGPPGGRNGSVSAP